MGCAASVRVGGSFYSPGMMGTSGTSSRLMAQAREDLDREISVIAEALRQHGALEREELKNLVGGRYWGPGRFAAALRARSRRAWLGVVRALSLSRSRPARLSNT